SHGGTSPGAATAQLDGNSWRIAGSALIDGSPTAAPSASPPAVPAADSPPAVPAERCQHLRTSSAVEWVPPQ
ncbi:MAG TPA: hypothetical protein VIT64_00490, partial [Ilumatobacteraceae bacterium]